MPTHLIIDGYNLIHACERYRVLLRRSIDAAREELVRDASEIHDAGTERVTVIFDGKGDAVTIERPTEKPSLSIVFAPANVSADGIIEQLVAKRRPGEAILVASRDNLVGESTRAGGGTILSVEDFLTMGSAAREQTLRVTRKPSFRGAGSWNSGFAEAWKNRNP